MSLGGESYSDELQLPNVWRRIDGWVIRITEIFAFLIGITFTVLILIEVFSRYVFSFSIFEISSAATFLLVWFFLIGAGLALRHRAHVGFEVALTYLPPSWAYIVFFVAQAMMLFYFVALAWSGFLTLGPASRQIEGGLQISYVWVMIAFPIGFGLLIYHQAVLFVSALHRQAAGNSKR